MMATFECDLSVLEFSTKPSYFGSIDHSSNILADRKKVTRPLLLIYSFKFRSAFLTVVGVSLRHGQPLRTSVPSVVLVRVEGRLNQKLLSAQTHIPDQLARLDH